MKHSHHIPDAIWTILSTRTKVFCLLAKNLLLMDLFKIYWVFNGSYWNHINHEPKTSKTSFDLDQLITKTRQIRQTHIQGLVFELLLYLLVLLTSPVKTQIISAMIALSVIHVYAILFQNYNLFLARINRDYLKKIELEKKEENKEENTEDEEVLSYREHFTIYKHYDHTFHIKTTTESYRCSFSKQDLAKDFVDYLLINKTSYDLLNLCLLGEVKRLYRLWSQQHNDVFN